MEVSCISTIAAFAETRSSCETVFDLRPGDNSAAWIGDHAMNLGTGNRLRIQRPKTEKPQTRGQQYEKADGLHACSLRRTTRA
jgi:hypothetical protein